MKIVPDTNVLIEFFRSPARRVEFDRAMNRPLLYISSVVAMELAAGCRDPRHSRALARFLRPFETAGRIITPDYGAFVESGRTIAALAFEGIGKTHLQAIVNDVLIGVSAARSGAIVLTKNAGDFARIAEHTRVRWMGFGGHE